MRAIMGSFEVPRQDSLLVDVVIGQKAIGRLGAGPVLAREGSRTPGGGAKFMKQAAQPPAQSCVAEFAADYLVGYPRHIVG
jgi:hypothetical protein